MFVKCQTIVSYERVIPHARHTMQSTAAFSDSSDNLLADQVVPRSQSPVAASTGTSPLSAVVTAHIALIETPRSPNSEASTARKGGVKSEVQRF